MIAKIVQALRPLKYEFVKEIGFGSFGLVSRFRDERKQDWAVKWISNDDLNTQQYEESVNKQLKNTEHPNIIKIDKVLRSIPEHNGDLYIIMEYCDAGNMDENRWEFSAQELMSIMKGVLEGLLHMHNNKIVHRDIKPANILLKGTKGARVAKLCDFGASRTFEKDQLLWTVIGTEPYMAPDYEKGFGYDDGVDIWAFGAVLYEMITGEIPFPDPTVDKIAVAKGFKILPQVFENIFRPNPTRDSAKELLQKVFGKGFTEKEYKQIEAIRQNARKKYKPNKPPPAVQQNVISRQETFQVKHRIQEMPFEKPQENVLAMPVEQQVGTQTLPMRRDYENAPQPYYPPRPTAQIYEVADNTQDTAPKQTPNNRAKTFDAQKTLPPYPPKNSKPEIVIKPPPAQRPHRSRSREVRSREKQLHRNEPIQPAPPKIPSQKITKVEQPDESTQQTAELLEQKNRKLQKDLELALGANKELKADLQQHRKYKLEAERLREVANDRHNAQQLKASQQENQRLHQEVQELKLELHRRQLSSQQLVSKSRAQSQRQQKMFDDQVQELRTLLVDSIRKCQNIVKEWMLDRRDNEEKLREHERISQQRHIEIGKLKEPKIQNSSTDWAFNVREAEKEKAYLKHEIGNLIEQKAGLIKQRDELKEQLAEQTQKSTEESVKFEQLQSKHNQLQRKFKTQQSENRQLQTIANRQSSLAKDNQKMVKKVESLTAELQQRTKQFFKLEDEKEKLVKQVDILMKSKSTQQQRQRDRQSSPAEGATRSEQPQVDLPQ